MKQLELPLGGDQKRKRLSREHLCLYCGMQAGTRDHVPPKSLLEQPWPINLRTVPACSRCNNSWSLDEEYLTVLLAHLGVSKRLEARVEPGGKVNRALEASPALEERLIRSMFVSPDGCVMIAPDLERVANLASKIACGLYALKYGRGATRERFSCAAVAGPDGHLPPHLWPALWTWPGMSRKCWTVVQPGVFSFIFAKGWFAGDAPLYCFMNLHDTILVVVACPPASARGKAKLPSPAW